MPLSTNVHITMLMEKILAGATISMFPAQECLRMARCLVAVTTTQLDKSIALHNLWVTSVDYAMMLFRTISTPL